MMTMKINMMALAKVKLKYMMKFKNVNKKKF